MLAPAATAINLLAKTPGELRRLRELGLSLLYIGPESGDDTTLKGIAKGAGFDDHVAGARLAREAGIKLSAIFLLGAGGVERSGEHAIGSARLATAMDPRFVSLTLTVIRAPSAKLGTRAASPFPRQGLLRGSGFSSRRRAPRIPHEPRVELLAAFGRLRATATGCSSFERALDGRVPLGGLGSGSLGRARRND